MKVHHVGMAVENIESSRSYLEELGGNVISAVFEDPNQSVKVQFIDLGGQVIELVAPAGERSPVDGVLKSKKRLYHICYEVKDLEGTIKSWLEKGAVLVTAPTPAVAFNGRRVAFLMTLERDLFEFLESR